MSAKHLVCNHESHFLKCLQALKEPILADIFLSGWSSLLYYLFNVKHFDQVVCTTLYISVTLILTHICQVLLVKISLGTSGPTGRAAQHQSLSTGSDDSHIPESLQVQFLLYLLIPLHVKHLSLWEKRPWERKEMYESDYRFHLVV